MPAKTRVTKEILLQIATCLYGSETPEQIAVQYSMTVGKIERLAAKLRKAGAKIPEKPRVYASNTSSMIAELKKEHPEAFNG